MQTTIIMTTAMTPAEVLAKLGLGASEATVVEATVPVAEKPQAAAKTTTPASKPPAAKDEKPQRKQGGGGRRKQDNDNEYWNIEFDEKQSGRMVIWLGMVKKNDKEIAVAVVESTDTHYRLAFIAKSGKCAYSNTTWKVKVAELEEKCEATIENALMMKVMF